MDYSVVKTATQLSRQAIFSSLSLFFPFPFFFFEFYGGDIPSSFFPRFLLILLQTIDPRSLRDGYSSLEQFNSVSAFCTSFSQERFVPAPIFFCIQVHRGQHARGGWFHFARRSSSFCVRSIFFFLDRDARYVAQVVPNEAVSLLKIPRIHSSFFAVSFACSNPAGVRVVPSLDTFRPLIYVTERNS